MNQRIRELARQSGGIDLTNHTAGGTTTWVGTGTPEFLEKFAELIVRECVLISRTSTDGFSAGRRMEEHFGVADVDR